MKLLGINGSPHKKGNTYTIINEVCRGAQTNGHHCEIIHLVDLNLDYCNWCGECFTTGICPIDDGYQEHLRTILDADVLIVGTPSSTRTVTGYMKNWLDRFCNTQLIYKENEENQSRIPEGKKAVIIVHGSTNKLQETLEPINAVMQGLGITVLDRLVIPKVVDAIDKRTNAMRRAFHIGQKIQ